jgi:glutathione S-transferase
MEAKLYVILGSHACRTGMLMLEHKRIEYELVELPTGLHPFVLRLHGFAGNPAPFRRVDDGRHRMLRRADRMGTVPSLLVDGQRVKANREIARFLENVRPDPPLFPADPDLRKAVEEAQRWGDEVFQMTARRLVLSALLHGPDALVERGGDGRLGPLLWRQPGIRRVGARFIGRFVFAADERADAELLAALPRALDRIDAWIEGGVLDSDQLYAADFMIAPSLALLSYRRDLRAEIDRRPAVRLLDRILPEPPAVAARYPSSPAGALS